VRTKGTKHISTAITHFSLGLTLLKTCKPTETLEAVALLTKAGKILRRVAAEDDPRLLAYAQTLERAQAALACAVKNIFASVILSVAGKIHPEILRLMWVMADMQTLKFFNLVGDEDDIGSECFKWSRASMFSYNRNATGLAVAYASAIHTHLSVHGTAHPTSATSICP